MKKIFAIACSAVSFAAHAEDPGFEVSIMSQFTDASSLSVVGQAPIIWGVRPGLELGKSLYWGISTDGYWEANSVSQYAINIGQQRTIVQDFALNATLALGIMRVHGRRVTDAPKDLRDENINFMNLRIGIISNNSEKIVPEIGVSLLSHNRTKAIFVEDSSTLIRPDATGMYAKLGYRF